MAELDDVLEAWRPISRRTCPPPDVLWQLIEGTAPDRVGAHVVACPLCADDVADGRALAEQTVWEVVLSWTREGLRALSSLCEVRPLAGEALRGPGEGLELRASGGGLRCRLELEPRGRELLDLRCTVTRGAEPVAHRLELVEDGKLLELRSSVAGVSVLEALTALDREIWVRAEEHSFAFDLRGETSEGGLSSDV